MLSKTARPYDASELPAPKRLRANVADLYATNQLSAKRIQEVINDIADSGVPSFACLKRPLGPNVARAVKAGFLKRNQWPSLYMAEIRVLGKRSQLEEVETCAFLLPHEYTEVLHRLGSKARLLDTDSMDPKTLQHLELCQRKCGTSQLLGLGLWGDGVPCNWDRTESVETLALNLPGVSGKYHGLRLPITGVSRKQISRHTWHDLMKVIAWSLQCCADGHWPSCRHDGTAWQAGDAKRARKTGSLGMQSCLVEVRGDWKFFGETFSFPKHNTKAGICWKCLCTPAQVIARVQIYCSNA